MRVRVISEGSERSSDLAPGPVLVGRSGKCDLTLDHAGIARRHALIVRYGSDWHVHTLTPAKLTLNGKAVGDAPLNPGDTLRLPGHELHFVEGEDDSAESSWIMGVLGQPPQIPKHPCRLDFMAGGRRLKSLSVDRNLIVGSGQLAQIRVPKRGVSTLHLLLAWVGGRWHMHDLNSASGTFRDDRPFRSMTVKGPMRIQLGDYQIDVIPDDESAPRPEGDTQTVDVESFLRGEADDLTVSGSDVPDRRPADAPLRERVSEPIDPAAREKVQRAEQLARTGQLAEAVRLYGKACHINPYVVSYRQRLRELQRQLRPQPPAPWSLLRRLGGLLRQGRAWLAVRADDHTAALDRIESGLTADPWSRPLLLQQALVFERSGRPQLCLMALRQLERQAPTAYPVQRPLARIFQALDRPELALRHWRRLREAHPDDPYILRSMQDAMVDQTIGKGHRRQPAAADA